jgi:hypothetical protein
VALRWQGNPGHSNNRRCFIDGALLKPLLNVPGIRFAAMRKTPTVRELLPVDMQQHLIDFGDACINFVKSAHAMRRVDLVVTVNMARRPSGRGNRCPCSALPAVYTGFSLGAEPHDHPMVPDYDALAAARGVRLRDGPRRGAPACGSAGIALRYARR